MRIFLSTGEASGDQHASKLVRELRRLDQHLEFTGIGGESMSQEGVKILVHSDELSVIGFQEALGKIPKIMRLLRYSVREAGKAACVILVDNPGFNLRLARYISRKNIPLVYYVVPQVWAWGRWRIRTIKRYVDMALTILPFEEPLLRAYGVDARYVGHPILDELPTEKSMEIPPLNSPQIGFLPGSREDEVRRLLPHMITIMDKLRDYLPGVHFHLSVTRNLEEPELKDSSDLSIYEGSAQRVILNSHLVVVASGTASLEAGLLGRPQIVLYALSDISWILARYLAKVRWVSLVNILLNKELVPEYIQRIDAEKVAGEVMELVQDRKRYELIRRDLLKLKEVLGEKGAPRRAAREILRFIEKRT